MKAFLAKYSGVTHAVAVAWIFLVSAYAGSSQFHEGVNNLALTIYHSLPAGLATVVSTLFGLGVSLYAFYRNGTAGAGKSSGSGTSGAGTSVVVALLVSSLLLGTTGCAPQQTAAALIAEVGNAVASLETVEGNSAIAAKVKTDAAAAESAVLNWKNGTPASDVIEALNLLEDDLNLLPVNATDAELIDIAIGGVEGILELLPQPATTTSTTASSVAFRNAVYLVAVVPVRPHPHSKKEFKKLWNAAVAKHPQLAKAKR